MQTSWEAAVLDEHEIFRAQYLPMVRLAHLLGSDDPENAAQEAFARLHGRMRQLKEPAKAVGYLRTCLVNLTRSQHTHRSVVERYQPPIADDAASAEQLAMNRAEHAVVIAALQRLSARHREALANTACPRHLPPRRNQSHPNHRTGTISPGQQ